MRASWSVAVLMIAMGGISVSGVSRGQTIGKVGWALAGLLVVSGALLFLRRPAAFYLGLAAAAVTSVSGVVGLAGHPELGLGVPPGLATGVGLYLLVRLYLAREPFFQRAGPSTEEDRA